MKTNENVCTGGDESLNLFTHLQTLRMDEKRVDLNDILVENDDMTHVMYLFLYEECQEAMRLRERTIHLALDIYQRVLRRRNLRAF